MMSSQRHRRESPRLPNEQRKKTEEKKTDSKSKPVEKKIEKPMFTKRKKLTRTNRKRNEKLNPNAPQQKIKLMLAGALQTWASRFCHRHSSPFGH